MDRLHLRRNLGVQLFALYLLFVGPVLAAALIFDRSAGARLEEDIKTSDLALAQSVASETDALLINALNTVANMSFRPEVQSGDLALQAELFENIAAARDEIDLVYRLDENGIMQYHYPEGPGSTVGMDFSFRAYFKNALIARESFMTIGRQSPTTRLPVVTAYMPIRSENNEFLGIVATNLNLNHLSATLTRISENAGGEVRLTIIDGGGQIVADSEGTPLLEDATSETAHLVDARTLFPDETQAVLRGEQGSRLGQDAQGREWLRSYVFITSSNWGVIVQRPADVAFGTARAFDDGILMAIGIFIAGGAFFWLMLTRRVIRPLEQLATYSASIGQPWAEPSDRLPIMPLMKRADQVGRLVRVLDQAEREINRRFKELTTLLDTSTAVVSTLDSHRVLETILDQVRRLLGVNMCAIIEVDERTGELRLRASRGLSDEYVRYIKSRSLPPEPNLPSVRAIATGRVVQVSDTEIDHSFPPGLRDRARLEGYRALMAVPLVAPHALPAVLIVYWREPRQCTVEEMSLIVSFANHAAMAIENAALFALTDERLREQTRTLQALVQSLNDGLILESSEGLLLYWNRRISDLAGIAPEDVHQYSSDALRAALLKRAQTVDDHPPHIELTIEHRGRIIDLRLQSFDVTDDHGELIGRGQLWLDVTGDKELDRMKSALIAIASHELRSPLAIIKGNITSLLAKDVQWDEADQREFLQAASLETDHLSALVTDLLDLSRIQAGTFVINSEPCALMPLVDQAVARSRPAPSARLTVHIAGDLPLCAVDPPRIVAVIRNLIENAVKYSPSNTPIELRAVHQDHQIIVSVVSRGQPIPPDEQSRLFDRFYQIDNSLSRQTDGAGLGLAICKGFVEAHGGSIWVESGANGTTFSFSLPLAQPERTSPP